MTYVSKKEKVFDLPEQDEISVTKSESKLKSFASVSDRRAWTSEECQRYQHLYGLVNGSETNIAKSSSFKYIPFDVLLAILMAEKDAYIQELLEKQNDNRQPTDFKAKMLYKSDSFEDSDDDREALIRKDAEVVALKNKISGLESELEDYRDTITKAMHKLERMDVIINENNFLKEKVKCSEETIKCLEAKKVNLEKELEYYKDLDNPKRKQLNLEKKHHWDGGDCNQLVSCTPKKDILIQQVQELQMELEVMKKNAAEVEKLKKISLEATTTVEELSKENESYKQKLESIMYLEKNVEELRNQGQALTEKYKRESQRANDLLKQIQQNSKELEDLKHERDDLKSKVSELKNFESQYISLKSKLHQVEFILDENEILNQKLVHLDRLELENEKLKMRIEQLKHFENQAVEDKEKILQYQCVVMEQEQEIARMLKHVQEMCDNYPDKDEVHRLRVELEEKDFKLKNYEKQLNEIPVLELEIDKLKTKLQNCIEDFKADKDLLKKLQEELEACRKRCHELEELPSSSLSDFISESELDMINKGEVLAVGECRELCQQPKLEYVEKGENTIETEKHEAESQSEKLQVEDKTVLTVEESATKIQEIEEQNEVLKREVSRLTSEISLIDLNDLYVENNNLKNLLNIKENEIFDLNEELEQLQKEVRSHENLKEVLLEEVKLLKEGTSSLEEQLNVSQEDLSETKVFLEKEKKGREFALSLIKGLEENLETEKEKRAASEHLLKLQKEEANMAKQEIYFYFGKEISNLKNIIHVSKNLIHELGVENKMLRDMKEFLEEHEIKALNNLIARLRAEVNVLKSLSKPELQNECGNLQQQVKILLEETDNLISEINELKLALNSEKTAKESLEKEVMNLQSDLTACVSAGKAVLEQEVIEKENLISDLKKNLEEMNNNFNKTVNESEFLKDKNQKLAEKVDVLECEQKELKNQINLLRSREGELKKTIGEKEEKEIELNKAIKEREEKEEEFKKDITEREEREKKLKKVLAEFESKEKEFQKTVVEHMEKEKELRKTIAEYVEKEKEYLEKTRNLEEIKEELKISKKSVEMLRERINELEVMLKVKEESLKMKEEEMESGRKMYLDAKNEMSKLKSEIDVLKSRLDPEIADASAGTQVEAEAEAEELPNYEKDLEEKYALEEALRKLENELDGLKTKLKECRSMEEEMSNLKYKKDSLLQKMSGFEDEVEGLKKKFYDFESVKNELDELKAKKNGANLETELTNLYEEFMEQKAQISDLTKENESLKEDLKNSENLLEIYKNLQIKSTETQMTPTAEFFTPPPVLSPRFSDPNDSGPETIELEVHKKEISDIENRYEQKIQNMNIINAERLKKLNENYEKEAKCRTKIYYESINTIKTSYENDIKKLVEKHKVSIMRLQGLHEDEVQELNTMYETQMEAMQTQNENLLNDLKTETAEKNKILREQHNCELKNLTIKYEELLKEKEAQYLMDKSKMEAILAEKEIHKHKIDNMQQFYDESRAELEEKHNQELKKLKKSNLKKIELIKDKYEALLVEERKKYEEQLEEMLIQLKNGQREDSGCKIQSKPPPPTSPSLNFHEVLQKILNEGLECLTVEELILVHSKTCFLPQIIGDETGDGEYSSRIGDGCRHRVLMTAEKEELLKRIFTLEHEIVIKQLETHEAIVNMEAAEMCRVQELKSALCSAQQKNAELKQLLSNQSKYEMDLKIDREILDRQAALHETNVMQKVKELERVKAEKRRLEEDLQMEKGNVKNLTAAIEAEKERYQSQRKRDAEYVESMRKRLEEALSHEQMMETQLDYEIKVRNRLETEIQRLEHSLSYIPELHSSPLRIDIKPMRNRKNPDESEVTKQAKVKRSRSKHRSKLKTISN